MRTLNSLRTAMLVALALFMLACAANGAAARTVAKPSNPVPHRTVTPAKATPPKPSVLFPAYDDFGWGYIDKTGKVVSSGYEDAGDYSEGLAAVKIAGRCGYVDTSGKIIIPARYDWAGKFAGGLAPIQVGKLWGYIDKTGKTVIEPKYDNAFEFSEGLAAVSVDGKFGAIDKTGAVVIQPTYEQMNPMSEGLIAVSQSGKWGFVDKAGAEIIAPQYDRVGDFSSGLAPAKSAGKFGFIDKTGKWVVEPKYDDAQPFGDGLAAVGIGRREVVKNDKGLIVSIKQFMDWGYIDATGKEVIPIGLGQATRFSEGLGTAWTKGEFSFIDKTGKAVLLPLYNKNTGSFHNGLAKTQISTRYGFIDQTGRMVVPQQFSSAQPFSDGLAAVEIHEGGPWGYINTSGQMVIQPQYRETLSFRKGLARAEINYRWGIIDKTGKVVVKPDYDEIAWYTDKLVAAKVNDLWGFYDSSGQPVLPPQFQSASFLGDNQAIVGKDNKYGVVDATGKLVVPTEYDDCGWLFSEELLPVSKGGNYGFIDAVGKSVIDPQYDAAGEFAAGLCAVKVGQKWGFIDASNKMVIAPEYDSAVCFSQDRAAVKIGEMWGFIDKAGKAIVNPQYTDAGYFSCGLAPVQTGEKWGYVDATGKQVVPTKFDRADCFANNLAQVRLGNQIGYINTTGKTVWMSKLHPSTSSERAVIAASPVEIDADGIRTLKVRVAVDQVLRRRSDWQSALQKRMQAASELLEKNVKVRLNVAEIVPWESPEADKGEDPDRYDDRLYDALVDSAPPDPGEVVVGFTGRPSGTTYLGFTYHYYNRVIVFDPYEGAEDRELQVTATVAHEILHTFGVFHVADAESLMHPTVEKGHVKTFFDDYTVRQLDVSRGLDFARGVDSLTPDQVTKAASIFADGHLPDDSFSVANAHTFRGGALLRTDLAGAIAEYRKAVEIEGEQPDFTAVCRLGEALIKDGQLGPGIETLRKCPPLRLEQTKAAKWHNYLGADFENQMARDVAFAACQEPVKPSIQEICERYVRAKVKPDEILTEYRAAVKAAPDEASYHYKLGHALATFGQNDEALAEYQQAITLKPDNTWYQSELDALKARMAGAAH